MSAVRLKDLLDEAAGPGEVHPALHERAVARARRRSRRRRMLAVPLGLTVAASTIASVEILRPDVAEVSSTAPANPLLKRSRQDASRATPSTDVLLSGKVAGVSIMVFDRTGRLEEESSGGKAAQVWMAGENSGFTVAGSYLSYEGMCFIGDAVCEATRSSGLGFAAVVQLPGKGQYATLVKVPEGRTVSVTTREGKTQEFGAAAVATTPTNHPWKVKIDVRLATGKTYQLPLPPGGVVTTR